MKNPLRKRLLRELKSEIGKYLVIFILLTFTIGFVSGFVVADGSMLTAYEEGFEKYNVEDGNFRTTEKMSDKQRERVEALGVQLYDEFYAQETVSNGSTLRIYAQRDTVNTVCLMEGKLPQTDSEIAIDRMYADNNSLKVGDQLECEKHTYTISGLVALPDYSCLFEDNNDTMFDAVKFGVAIITPQAFAAYGNSELYYEYCWKYPQFPADEKAEKDVSEELMKQVAGIVSLESFVPRYANQAIQFTGDDMGSDETMMVVLLYIVTAIMAFVFGITTNNTITKEANVIGTLRASGYTKGELIRHYLAMPMFVTIAGAVIGNILGYTVFESVCADMYYGSYSLPTYVTIWSAQAFWTTTLVPLALMFVINLFILYRKLQLSPLKFLRRDLSRKQQKRTVPLPEVFPFFGRFRIRIMIQNLSSYIVLFIGILFANLLLIFGLTLPSALNDYQNSIQKNLLCNYQYVLKMPLAASDEEHKLESMIQMLYFQSAVETDNADAEKISMFQLKITEPDVKSESVTLYGVEKDGKYVPLDLTDGKVYISSAYAEKYGVDPGDEISLQEEYEGKEYSFTVDGIYPYEGAISIFMDREALNEVFDQDADYFCGYFSDSEITDIDEKYIGSVIDLDALTKISRQLSVSMGNLMYLVDGFAIVMYMILIYLLSKMIIEKNGQSISMVKILGYNDREISRLYVISTTLVVVFCLLVSLPIEGAVMKNLFRIIMRQSMIGWIPCTIGAAVYIKMILIGILTYAVVAAFEYRKIRRVPMDAALKNVE